MVYKDINPKELKEKFLQELVNIFDINNLDDLEIDIKENGILNPPILSKDGIPIDGLRRILVAINLGMESIKVSISDLEATPDNRIALNNFRELTWKDQRNLFMLLFVMFKKKQGDRSDKQFNRYSEIAIRSKNKFKDSQTLQWLELILNDDKGDFPLSKWIFEFNCDVKSTKEFMDKIKDGSYTELYKQVSKMELSPKAALKIINDSLINFEAKKKEFKIPNSNGIVAEIHHGDPAEKIIEIEKNSVKTLFYTPDRFSIIIEDDDGNYPRVKKQEPKVYGQKIVDPIRPWIDRLKKGASIMVFTQESYHDGFAQQIPSNIINAITMETPLVYKQTLFLSDGELLTEKNSNKHLNDAVTQILWFVKDQKEATELFSQPTFIDTHKRDGVETETYKKCSNYLSSQEISKLILNKGFVVKGEDNINYAALVPLVMSTKEDDLVVDISMKNDIGTIAIMMNRRYIGITPNESSFKNNSQALTNAVKEFSPKTEKNTETKNARKPKKETVSV